MCWAADAEPDRRGGGDPRLAGSFDFDFANADEPMIRKPLRLIPAALLLSATPAFAAEGGGPLDVNTGLLIWSIVIFTIVFLVLRKYAWPQILGAVEAREQHIRDLLAQAERDRAEAHALLEENRRQLETTRNEVQAALAESRASAEQVREEILSQARREQDEMLVRARREIASERSAALDSVRREAVDLSIAAAERLLRRNLSADDNRRLVTEYLERVEVTPAGAGA